MAPTAIVIRSDTPSAAGLRPRVSAQLLGGTTSVHEGVLAPKELVPPHTHEHEDQCLYVVSGIVHLEIGEEPIEAVSGTYVVKPRGVPHAFWNPGTTLAHVLEITAPGGFEGFYEEMATAQSPAEALTIQAKYGITFHRDRIADLVARHHLVGLSGDGVRDGSEAAGVHGSRFPSAGTSSRTVGNPDSAIPLSHPPDTPSTNR